MSNARHDNRLQVMVQEVNYIRTATKRADLFADSVRDEFRSKLSAYLTTRIDLYNAGVDEEMMQVAQGRRALYADSPFSCYVSRPHLSSAIDLDRPNRGFITLDKAETLFLELRNSLYLIRAW